MPAQAAHSTPAVGSAAQVCDLIAHRVLRALAERVRYRYVQPRVWRDGTGFRVESPCCSRNVEPEGGVIDIALLLPPGAAGDDGPGGDDCSDAGADVNQWRLYARNHAQGRWQLHEQAPHIDELLDVLCLDPRRLFWP